MAWIEIIDENDASGRLRTVYSSVKSRRGKIINLMRTLSLNPQGLKAYSDLYVCLMIGQSSLSREQRELLATAVSATNKSDYGISHHGEALNYYWKNADRIKQFIDDIDSIYLPDKERAMINYAVKITKNPSAITEEDIKKLRNAGFSDEDILNINLIASYFNFENRVAEGLGVEVTLDDLDSKFRI
ncbi:MAG: peroxidase-related enzyme [Candidatus Thorarchaeota archaeon]